MKVKQKLFLLRHGARVDAHNPNWRKFAERPYDPPLAPYGYEQARMAADTIQEHLADRSHDEFCVLSSPFLRCVQTAEIVAGTLGCTFGLEYALCERLHPRFIYGDKIEWLNEKELERHYPHFERDMHTSFCTPTPPDEGRSEVRRRCQSAVKRIVFEEWGGPWILIGHGFTMKDAGLLFGGSGKIPKKGELRLFEVEVEE